MPSQLGWIDGSAIRSKILSAVAEIMRVARTMPWGSGSGSIPQSKHQNAGPALAGPALVWFLPSRDSQRLDRPGQDALDVAGEVVGQHLRLATVDGVDDLTCHVSRVVLGHVEL